MSDIVTLYVTPEQIAIICDLGQSLRWAEGDIARANAKIEAVKAEALKLGVDIDMVRLIRLPDDYDTDSDITF